MISRLKCDIADDMQVFVKSPFAIKRLLQSLSPAGVLGVLAARSVGSEESNPRFLPLTTDQVIQNGEQAVGVFTRTIDEVHRLYQGEKFGVALLGEDALSNETLSSFGNGSVTVKFLDGTQLTVGPNSEVILDEFVYDSISR